MRPRFSRPRADRPEGDRPFRERGRDERPKFDRPRRDRDSDPGVPKAAPIGRSIPAAKPRRPGLRSAAPGQ